jgi:acyl-CoA synthetase (NDP forming)
MLERLLTPASICLIGASADPAKLAGKTLVRLEQHHFPGAIHLVNPRYAAIGDRVCVPRVADVPAGVDVAFISLPAALVPGAVRECGEAGIPFAVVISSGFAEDAGAAQLSRELDDAVRESGVRLVGPNCEGIWSTPASMALTFGSAADRPVLLSGGVSLISQSGSIGGACMSRLQALGVGCRYFVSSGNEMDLTSMDFLEHIVDEGESTVVALFVEGLRDGHRLPAIARRAARKGIRIIALCAGASDAGREATSSHTGRIASAADVYRDVLAQSGILQVETLSDFVAAIHAADLASAPLPATHHDGGGVSIVATSGGSRALLADACSRYGVPMARYTPATEATLDALLPAFASSPNPTDLTGQVLSDPELFARVLDEVARDPHTESVIVQYANGAETQLAAQMELYRALTTRIRKPVIVSLLGRISEGLAAGLRDLGIYCVHDPQDAVRTVRWLNGWRDGRAVADRDDLVAPSPAGIAPVGTWQERMELLSGAGVRAPGWRIWYPDDPRPDLAFPVVLKALPELAEHKTESGLVFVGIGSEAEFDEVAATFSSRVPPGTPALVQEMVSGGVEVLLAARSDPDFGPVLALGAGGVTTEWLRDVGYVPLPASADEIRAALERRAVWELLQPFRGRARADIDDLVRTALAVADIYLTRMEPGSEIELNPLIVGAGSSGAWAVDVLCTPRT